MKTQPQLKRNHGRAPGQRHLTASVEESLVAQIDAMASAEGRNRSEMLRVLLKDALALRRKGGRTGLADMEAIGAEIERKVAEALARVAEGDRPAYVVGQGKRKDAP